MQTADPDACPKARPGSFIRGHTMRLESSDGSRERWRCINCGREEIRPFTIPEVRRG